MKYTFCPGKATWYPEMLALFDELVLAYHTGIFPDSGSFYEQDELFVECFPQFYLSFKERNYGRVWSDVVEFSEHILKAVAKMFGGKKGK